MVDITADYLKKDLIKRFGVEGCFGEKLINDFEKAVWNQAIDAILNFKTPISKRDIDNLKK